ncbi:MAG: hypothetical protein JXR70_10600 [Spirochaetales bacterium]|nr:hypothetical protein [Spirochaetales bacterium]
MKFNTKTMPAFVGFLIAGLFLGSLAWEVVERILHLIPALENFSFTMEEPIQVFDFYVLSLSFRANPGTFMGLVGSVVMFFAL